MIDWSTCPAVERDAERVSGTWVFRGTRVPVATLFENLEDGASASEFVEWFPGVTREQVRGVLDHAARSAVAVDPSLTPAQERELDRRITAYHEDGDPGQPWEDALREIEASRPWAISPPKTFQ